MRITIEFTMRGMDFILLHGFAAITSLYEAEANKMIAVSQKHKITNLIAWCITADFQRYI